MRRFILVLIAFSTQIFTVFAIEPERREVIVVKLRAWDGYQYKEAFLPSKYPELTLIAGQDSALTFVRTEEYFWPLSRQVYVDFEKQQDVIDGILRIEKDDKIISEAPLQSYSIFYPEGAINGNGKLLWDEEAISAFNADQKSQRDFAVEFVEAQRSHTEYERRLLESGKARVEGKPIEVIPPPPPIPSPNLQLVTKPVQSFRIGLDAGQYKVSVLQNGQIVPGTERSLRVVSVTGRNDVVADVIPEERWTQPLASNSLKSRIYARPGAVFYLSVIDAQRYNEEDYLPVISPQAQVVRGRQMWIRRKPSVLNKITVDDGIQSQQSLKVDQTSGSSFGYVVRRIKNNETPDLKAFEISLPNDPAKIRSVIKNDAGFYREVVIVQQRLNNYGLGLALLPLLGSAFLIARRRIRLKTE